MSTRRGPGGVVTALASLARVLPLTWVAVALADDDHIAFPTMDAPARDVRLGQQRLRVRYVPLPAETQRRHYDEVSNKILWFLQHYLFDAAIWPDFTDADYRNWTDGYRAANEALADAIRREAVGSGRDARTRDGSGAIVLLQDYHWYLAPAMVRRMLPRAVVQQFIHIPWPALRYWEFLPHEMLHEIFVGLAATDVLGFQTDSDVTNFLGGAEELLAGSRVDFEKNTVYWHGHRTRVSAYPIPIDADDVRRDLNSAAGRRSAQELGPLLTDGLRTIVRVDRLDPTKNVVRGFKAYELLLQRYPELRGTVRFLAFLVPSREGLKIYKKYDQEVRKIIRHINTRYGTETWRPIEAFFENNRARALAAMRRYDALLVNVNIDGMNLVAKEGPSVNERDGVVILSRAAGAFDQLADAVLPVTPTDIEETATRLYEALKMPVEMRHTLAVRAKAIVSAETPTDWILAQLHDATRARRLHRPAPPSAPPSAPAPRPAGKAHSLPRAG